MFGNPRGEIVHCNNCNRFHDILRKHAVFCACGNFIKSKEFSKELFMKNLEANIG